MNQNPEQKARDEIDKHLNACGWIIQSKANLNVRAASGVAVREYLTDAGPADYVLFVDGKPSVPLKDLLHAVTVGNQDEDVFTSLANRLLGKGYY